jgi:hypothetical protein
MNKYRFKTEQEFKDEGSWINSYPSGWNADGEMNYFLGQEIPEEFNSYCDSNSSFKYEDWRFEKNNYILINKVVPGKWYEVSKNAYRKAITVESNHITYKELIDSLGYSSQKEISKCNDLSRFVLAAQEELNKYLPEGHSDKIVKQENYEGRTIKALKNNPECTGVLLGEQIKIIKINLSETNYILDKTSAGYGDMHINIPLKLSDWELLPEIFNDINMDDIKEQAKLKYPIGCKFISADANKKNTLKSDINTYKIHKDTIWAHTGAGCLYYAGKWAEIIDKPSLPEYVKCVEGYGDAVLDTIYSTNDEKLADKLFSLSWYAVLIDCKHLGKRFVPYYGDPGLAINYISGIDSYENEKETKETTSIKTKKENKPSIEFVQSVAVNLRTKNKSIKF